MLKKIKFFFKDNMDNIFYGMYCVALLIVAFIFNRFIQMLMFILFYESIQNCFNKRFHADTLFPNNSIKAIKYCKIITIVVEVVYLIYCKNLNLSIYSNLLIILVIAILNALLQFYLERTINFELILKNKEILLQLCNESKLSSISTNRMVMRYVEDKSIQDIADIEFVDHDSIKKSLQRSRNKIKITFEGKN